LANWAKSSFSTDVLFDLNGGAEGDRTPDPLNAIQVAQLLTFILIELAETLVA